ncbi:MAG: alpha/beta hydrolase [Pseudomonadota bacterium]
MKIALGILCLLALAVGLTFWRAARNSEAALAEYPPTGEFVEVDGLPVHYLTLGTGPDLVLIHGASGNLRDFSFSLMDQLSDRYRVTAFDRPGLGYTPRTEPGMSIGAQADILAQAAAQLGIDRPLILGQSYGGAVTLAWATRHETSGLVLLAAASNTWDTGLGTYYNLLTSAPGQAFMAPAITAWATDARIESSMACIFAPGAVPEGYIEYFGVPLTLRTEVMRENALQRAGLLEEIAAQVPLYGDIDVPVEILHGDADPIVPHQIHSEPLSRQLPDARLQILPGQGHMLQHTAEPQVIEAIDAVAARAGLR